MTTPILNEALCWEIISRYNRDLIRFDALANKLAIDNRPAVAVLLPYLVRLADVGHKTMVAVLLDLFAGFISAYTIDINDLAALLAKFDDVAGGINGLLDLLTKFDDDGGGDFSDLLDLLIQSIATHATTREGAVARFALLAADLRQACETAEPPNPESLRRFLADHPGWPRPAMERMVGHEHRVCEYLC